MNQIVTSMKADLTAAMKAGDTLTRDTLRLVLGEIRTAESAGKAQKEFTDADTVQLLKREVKRRAGSAEEYARFNRQDRADRELAEVEVINKYLPVQLDDETVNVIIQEVIAEVGSSNFGAVMKGVTSRTAGQADGKRVSELVRAAMN